MREQCKAKVDGRQCLRAGTKHGDGWCTQHWRKLKGARRTVSIHWSCRFCGKRMGTPRLGSEEIAREASLRIARQHECLTASAH